MEYNFDRTSYREKGMIDSEIDLMFNCTVNVNNQDQNRRLSFHFQINICGHYTYLRLRENMHFSSSVTCSCFFFFDNTQN